MEHHFNIEIAEKYGVNCAIILNNFEYWIKKNEANGKHFHDGYYWTYNSIKAFATLFPYLTQKQIETAIGRLRADGIIVTGNYNDSKTDRTLWYAITEKGNSILRGGEMDFTCKGNGNPNEGKPISNINTDINADINLKEEEKVKKEKSLDEVIEAQPLSIQQPLREFVKMRKAIKKPITTHGLELAVKKLHDLAKTESEAVAVIEQSVMNSWQGFFALKKGRSETDWLSDLKDL